MLLSPIEMLLPLVMLVLIFVPLIKVIQGKTSVKSAKIRLTSHICMFFGVCLGGGAHTRGEWIDEKSLPVGYTIAGEYLLRRF